MTCCPPELTVQAACFCSSYGPPSRRRTHPDYPLAQRLADALAEPSGLIYRVYRLNPYENIRGWRLEPCLDASSRMSHFLPVALPALQD